MSAQTGITSRDLVLTVHPSVVFKLGQDLITDDVQALTELIKNTWDADSTIAIVSIETEKWTDYRTGTEVSKTDALRIVAARANLEAHTDRVQEEIGRLGEPTESDSDSVRSARVRVVKELAVLTAELNTLPHLTQGELLVRDYGTGMSLEDIERGWLTVSASRKRAFKREGRKTGLNRTPLGDKGLGRLGAQRLGRVLDLETKEASTGVTLRTSIYWDDFSAVESLTRVPITVTSEFDDFKAGSLVRIRGLNAREDWDRSNRVQVERELARMISPYEGGLGLEIKLTIDGSPVDLKEKSRALLALSSVTYELQYENGTLRIKGKIRSSYLKPDSGPEKIRLWNDLIASDGGHKFLEWLRSKSVSPRVEFEHGDDRHFCIFETVINLATLPDVDVDRNGPERLDPVDPGNFVGRVDLFQRRQLGGAYNASAETRGLLEALSGVRMYRDGFGIRLKSDWLDLAGQWTKASSYYTLRPDNVIGYINLTAAGNSALEETSNREDFSETPAYRNFQRLLGGWLQITEQVQGVLRRGYGEYLKEHTFAAEDVSTGSSSAELATAVKDQFTVMSSVAQTIENAKSAVVLTQSSVEKLTKNQSNLSDNHFVPPEIVASNALLLNDVNTALRDLRARYAEVEEANRKLRDRRGVIDLLVERLMDAEQQVRDVWEVVSLGITAETIAHEVLNITDNLSARSAAIAKYNDDELRDQRMGAYIEHVRSASRSLTKQVSHIDASLGYRRDRRDLIVASEFATDSISYFNDKWVDQSLTASVKVVGDFKVRSSRGKLSQVFDNLALNSEYWMKQNLAAGRAESGTLVIEISTPFIMFSDSGVGIDPGVEELLFDPFVTRKPREVGRGLGLFVVQQLLVSENVAISLDPDRNQFGNRFRFRLDFSAII